MMTNSLRPFYFLRAGVAYAWVAAVALTHLERSPLAAAALALYAAWDGIANLIDIRRDALAGGSMRQINLAVSFAAAAVMASGTVFGFNVAVVAFGVWALLSGVLQLLVGVRRRSAENGQLLMILSGAQSSLAGVFFTRMGLVGSPKMADLFPYAAFGATYFLASALWLAWSERRSQTARA